MLPNEFDELINLLKQLPGVSTKQATKIINFLFDKDSQKIHENVKKFMDNFSKIKECWICSYFTTEDKCNICKSNSREKKLMIVENSSQIQKYEDWKIFNGKYFKIPVLFNKKFEKINNNFDFSFFLKYINEFDEIILGLSPTPEGVLSSNFIFDMIKKQNPNKLITKLAIGIPMGLPIDYIDQITMSYALKNRKDIK